jgi:hypothetical protein
MPKLQKELQDAYDKFDALRERLEFSGLKKEQEILEQGIEALNRYLAVVEKFDRTKK